MLKDYEEKRARVVLSHGEIASVCILLDRDLELRRRRGQSDDAEYWMLAHLRRKLSKHWNKMGYWSRGKYLEYARTHGQLWTRPPPEIPEGPAPETERRVMTIGELRGRLTLPRPQPIVVAAFAQKYGDVEGLVTRLENANNPLSVTLHRTELGQEAYIELVLGEYRLKLTRKYAELFLDFQAEYGRHY